MNIASVRLTTQCALFWCTAVHASFYFLMHTIICVFVCLFMLRDIYILLLSLSQIFSAYSILLLSLTERLIITALTKTGIIFSVLPIPLLLTCGSLPKAFIGSTKTHATARGNVPLAASREIQHRFYPSQA